MIYGLSCDIIKDKSFISVHHKFLIWVHTLLEAAFPCVQNEMEKQMTSSVSDDMNRHGCQSRNLTMLPTNREEEKLAHVVFLFAKTKLNGT